MNSLPLRRSRRRWNRVFSPFWLGCRNMSCRISQPYSLEVWLKFVPSSRRLLTSTSPASWVFSIACALGVNAWLANTRSTAAPYDVPNTNVSTQLGPFPAFLRHLFLNRKRVPGWRFFSRQTNKVERFAAPSAPAPLSRVYRIA